jgi:hypothetical protein
MAHPRKDYKKPPTRRNLPEEGLTFRMIYQKCGQK